MSDLLMIVEIDHLSASIGKDRCTSLSVCVTDGTCFVQASQHVETAGVKLTLPPDDMIALGHACVAAGKYAKDQQE